MKYPLTGPTDTKGFAPYLAKNLGEPRANLRGFAKELGRSFGVDRITLTNSGSSANLAAALALAEVTRGKSASPGHAITAGFTFPTTMSALLAAGYRVTVADTEAAGFTLDAEALESAIRPDTTLVAVTHFMGFPASDALFHIARKRGLLVLQDACESMELLAPGERAFHRLGTLSTWSFYHPHHLSSFGGGAVISLDDPMRRRLESITHWGRACTCHLDDLRCRVPQGIDHNFTYVREGHNLEMSELNACFGRFQLAKWPRIERARKKRYEMLWSGLNGSGAFKASPHGGSAFGFPLRVLRNREALARRLRARGVETRTLMGGPITDQPAFRHVKDDGLENCRALARECLLLGIHQTLPEKHVRAVIGIVKDEMA